MSSEEYAQKHRTEEWIVCDCGTEFYRRNCHQNKRKNNKIVTKNVCPDCALKIRSKWYSESGLASQHAIKNNKKLNESGCRHEIAQKSADTRKERGINTASNIAKRRKEKDPDAFFKSAAKGTQTKIKRDTARKNRDNGTTYFATLKAFETKKKNGTNRRSNEEKEFYEIVEKILKEKNYIIENQYLFSDCFSSISCEVDILITKEDRKFLLQFDGVYFHGLKVPITEVAKCRTRTDRIIFDTYYRDVKLNGFCNKNNINLIRIADNEYRLFKNKRKDFMQAYFVSGISSEIDEFMSDCSVLK